MANASWRQTVAQYVKNNDMFRCPSNPSNNEEADVKGSANDAVTLPEIKRSYTMNINLIRAKSESGVQATGSKIMVAEAVYNNTIVNAEWSGDTWKERGYAGHLGTANYLYADGHVKALMPTKTATPLNQWGRGNADCTGFNDEVARINCDTVNTDMVNALNQLQQKYK